jgi:hypothetical protein
MIPNKPYVFINDVHKGAEYLKILDVILEKVIESSPNKQINLVLERESVFQELYGYAKSGSLNLEENAYMFSGNYGEGHEQEAEMWKKILTKCKDANVNIYCLDDRRDVSPEVCSAYDNHIKQIIEAPTQEEKEQIYKSGYIDSGLWQKVEEQSAMFEDRLSKKIKEIGSPENQVTITFIGGAHLIKEDGIDKAIPDEQKNIICIWNKDCGIGEKERHQIEKSGAYLLNSESLKVAKLIEQKYTYQFDGVSFEQDLVIQNKPLKIEKAEEVLKPEPRAKPPTHIDFLHEAANKAATLDGRFPSLKLNERAEYNLSQKFYNAGGVEKAAELIESYRKLAEERLSKPNTSIVQRLCEKVGLSRLVGQDPFLR